jgi:membrane protein DedA with SNARE-associated domain
MHAGRVPPNKGRLAMKERGKQRGFFRWQLGSAHSGKLRLRGNLHCCDAGERWCSAAGGNNPGQCCSIAGNKHSLDIRYVIAAAAGGAIFGDNIGFWVGREFGTSLLSRWGYLIGLDERKRKLGQYLFARHGGKIVFFGRFVALLRAFAALLAGANGLSPLRFLIFNAAGGIAWATVFGVGGYVLGEGIRRIAGPFGWAVLIAAIVLAVLLWRYYKKNEERFLDEAEAAAANDALQQ